MDKYKDDGWEKKFEFVYKDGKPFRWSTGPASKSALRQCIRPKVEMRQVVEESQAESP
jgi:hypothetical protein